jgi:hypothetical protein
MMVQPQKQTKNEYKLATTMWRYWSSTKFLKNTALEGKWNWTLTDDICKWRKFNWNYMAGRKKLNSERWNIFVKWESTVWKHWSLIISIVFGTTVFTKNEVCILWLCLRNHTREEILGVKLPSSEAEEQEKTTEETASSAYKCPICLRTLLTQQQLGSHVAMHTDNNFPCHICGKVVYIGWNYKNTKLSLYITNYALCH